MCKLLTKRFFINFFLLLTVSTQSDGKSRQMNHYKYRGLRKAIHNTKNICMDISDTIRARHKSCFLRADTGPCRADILQWYFDAKQKKCYRFFWGGCQGNGNRFETKDDCLDYCYLESSAQSSKTPYFCQLSFDYGTCFGQYYRWSWDRFSKTCKQRLYSGCGGNQNNFETKGECMHTCLIAPNITFEHSKQTTCFPVDLAVLNDK